ncbi:protocadherin Fat 4-like isoform X3 [Apostichopus japonicus]
MAENESGPIPFTITVEDLDYLEVNRDYVITSDGGSNVTINETSGTVYVYGPFDRERQSQFEFSLFVENTAQPRFRTTQYVVVKITDENDESPTFTDETMSNCKQLDVTEGDVGLTPADPLCTFQADDHDEPGNENSVITYTVDNDEYFIMNNETGELSLQKALDRETNDSITIVVTASDNGKPRLSTEMSVSILIEGINDEKPMFQNGEYQTYVHEETAINTKIYTLNATDPDLPVGDPIYYKPRNPDDLVWETFYLNSVDGECEIYTLRPLEYSQTLYRLEIVTYDNDPSPYYSDVTEDDTALLVYVEQRTSCDITADSVDRTIDDAELKDDVVITSVIAKSSCNGSEDEIMFLLDEETFFPVSGEISTSHYSINEENGNIYAKNVSNIDVGTYLLTVTAYNTTGSTLDQSTITTEVFIIVNDTNNNCPYFDVKSYDARYMKDDPYLSSEMVPGWLVVTASDSDSVFIGDINFSNSAFDESLVEAGEAERSFLVAVNSDVSHDTNLTVTVSDNDNNCTSEETIIFITVMSSLAPMFEDDNYIEYITENMEAGDLVIQVSALNAKGTSEGITYNLVSPTNSPFAINDMSGEIFVAFEGIDYETEMSYVLNVSATDGRWPEARTSFTDVLVMVEDINEYSPSFLGLPADIVVLESAPLNSVVFILRAIDSDTDDNDRLEYSLTSGGNGKFVVDKESGSVSTVGTFDFERDSQTSYELEVQVSDGEKPVQDTLNIEIMDVNDNRPIFNDKAPSGNIPENDPTPYYINASATDVDSVNLNYTVSASAPINTEISEEGILNITGPFDREIEDSLTFSVTVSDGVFETKVEVNVTIEDENDNTPGFTSLCDGLVTVAENSPTGTSVCQISAIDEDKPDTVYSTIEYSLLDSVEDRFQINKITGEITVMNEKLDFEGVKTFSLTVVATDGGGNSNSSMIQVNLEDVNDNPPVFDDHPEDIDVVFDLEIGSLVFAFRVTDKDNAPFDSFLCREEDVNEASWDTFYLTTTRDGCNLMLRSSLNTSLSPYLIKIAVNDINNDALRNSTEAEIIVLQTYPCQLSLNADAVVYNKTDLKKGDPVADLDASSNCSGSEDGITYAILSQVYTSVTDTVESPSSEFEIYDNNGTVYYDQTGVTPSVGLHKLMIRAVNDTWQSIEAITELVITILDVDLEEPIFPDPPTEIPDNPDPESSPVFVGRYDDGDQYVFDFNSTERLLIVVMDNDACFNGDVAIVDPLTTPFTLEPLGTNDCQDMYRAYLKPTGQPIGNDPFTFQIAVTQGNYTDEANVTVVNVPLHPTFQGIPDAVVDETVDVGTFVTMVTAVNCDNSAVGIKYEIVQQTPAAVFGMMDPLSGNISVASMGIDYETHTAYNITVSATDTRWDSPRSYESTLEITVQDVNEFPPELAAFSDVILPEALAVDGALVYKITAFDRDGSATLMFALGNLTDTFEVGPTSGELILLKELDAEQDPLQYYVDVSVSDGEKVDEEVLFVQIIDVNEFPPNITGQNEAEMYENDTETTLQIYAYDPDISSFKITYSMEPDDGIGSIDATGLITFNGPLDFANKNRYDYVVTAAETDGLLSSVFEVTLNVLNINDQDPVLDITSCEGAKVTEGPDGVGVTLCTPQADDEVGSSFTFYLLDDKDGKFDIVSGTGELKVTGELDRESLNFLSSYDLEITVNDGGSPSRNSSTETVIVTVTDINDESPSFISPPTMAFVQQGSAPGTLVFPLTAEDGDDFPYNIARCEKLDSSDAVWENFTILNIESGRCEVITLVPLYAPFSSNVDVKVVDAGDDTKHSSASVLVVVISDGCFLTLIVESPLEFDEEDLGPGDPVTDVSVNSTCTGPSDFSYEITQQSLEDPDGLIRDVNVYEINDKTGRISVNASATVMLGTYTMVVTAYNSSSVENSVSDLLLITIKDINNQCPYFLKTLHEGLYAEGDSFVYSLDSPYRLELSSEDPDSEFVGSFSSDSTIFTPTSPTASTSPNLVTVQLAVAMGTTGNHTIQIEVKDNSFGSSCANETTVDIFEVKQEVLNPTFSEASYDGEVRENSKEGTSVLTVTAENFDDNTDDLVYSFAEQDNYFTIGASSGEIATGLRGIDYETNQTFVKVVRAEDTRWEPHRISEVTVYINVIDVDEYRLQLASIPPLSVTENTQINTVIYTAWATDGDASSTLSYSLADATKTFGIQKESGEIITLGDLDAEVNDEEYQVTVTVTDESTSDSDSQSVTIGISDMNDHVPEFNETAYDVDVTEETSAVYSVTVYATDDDKTTENNEITFSLDHDLNGRCSLDPVQGILTINATMKEFDRESTPRHEIVITATDGGTPPLSTTALIIVNVLDVNDNAPVFVDGSDAVVEIKEETAGDVIRLTAEDLDEGTNSEITYSVTSQDGSSTDLFSIDASGLLKADVGLDREETPPSYNLIVYATDSGEPPLNASVNVEVILLDIDDKVPEFQPPFNGVVESNATPGTKVVSVVATDEDLSPNNVIIYTPVNSTDKAWETFSLQTTADGTSIILVSAANITATTTFDLRVQASNPPDAVTGASNKASQLYEIVVIDGSLCYVELKPASFAAVETSNKLVAGEAIVDINGTSTCDGEDFAFQITSQILTFFNGSASVKTDDWFVISVEGVLSSSSSNLDPGIYEISVAAVNASDLTDMLSFTDSKVEVKILADNNDAPNFLNGGETVTLFYPVFAGDEVYKLFADDPDDVNTGNAFLTYTKIYEESEGIRSDLFEVDTDGQITIADNLPDLSERMVNVTVKVEDSALEPLSSVTYLLVELVLPELDDLPPTIIHDCSSIEYIAEGSKDTICTVSSNEEVTFTVSPDFEISIDGAITAATDLNYEQQQDYSVIVNATSTTTMLGASLQFIVMVTDVNEFAPTFESADTFTISEDNGLADEISGCPVTYEFGVVTATDQDGSDENTYTEYTLEGDARFTVDETTGVLSKMGCIDVDNLPDDQSITLSVTASNVKADRLLNSTQTITIIVTDVNDNSPILVVLNGTEVRRTEFVPNEILFQFDYEDDDIDTVNQDSSYSHDCSDPVCFDFLEFSTELGTIATNENAPANSVEILIIVTVTNREQPRLSESQIVTYIYSTEDGPVYFPEDIQNQSVTIAETAGFGNIIAPVGGTTETIYSVREEDGACSAHFRAQQASETILSLIALTTLDYDGDSQTEFVLVIAVAQPGDSCLSTSRRLRRETGIRQDATSTTTVHITIANMDDEPSSFQEFTVSRFFFRGIHISRAKDEKVYDLSVESGRVNDPDNRPDDLVFGAGDNDLVEVSKAGEVFLKKYLVLDDRIPANVDVPVTVSDAAGMDDATLRLRVMSNEDIVIAEFDPEEDPHGENLLSKIQDCFPTGTKVLYEREDRSQSNSMSALWLYGVDLNEEDFMDRETFDSHWYGSCGEKEETGARWGVSQIAVFLLAVMIFIASLIMILYLLCSYQSYEPQEEKSSQDTERLRSRHSEVIQVPIRGPTLLERIASEKRTSKYGSDEAFLELMSEADALSVDKLQLTMDLPHRGGEDEGGEDGIREDGIEEDVGDEDEKVDPYATFLHISKKSPEPNSAVSDTDDDDDSKVDTLEGYDNHAFLQEDKAPGAILEDHTKGETDTDDMLGTRESRQEGQAEGAEDRVEGNDEEAGRGNDSGEKSDGGSDADGDRGGTLNNKVDSIEQAEKISMNGGIQREESLEIDAKVTTL